MERQPLKHCHPRRLIIASLGLAFASTQAGCFETGDKTGDKTGDSGPDCVDEPRQAPEIDVDPHRIDFGEVDPEVMAEVSEFVTICNLGTRENLKIYNIELEGANPAFVLEPVSTVLITPGACASLEIIFQPQPGSVSEDAAVIDCSDRDCDGCPMRVSLRGEGTASE